MRNGGTNITVIRLNSAKRATTLFAGVNPFFDRYYSKKSRVSSFDPNPAANFVSVEGKYIYNTCISVVLIPLNP